MVSERGRRTVVALVGVSAGVATGVWIWWRRSAGRPALERPPRRAGGTADAVWMALRESPELDGRHIQVNHISDGVLELTGAVAHRSESERAVSIARSAADVHTVVNRLRIEDEESQREATRRRWTEGAPDLRERHHYGMGVGMGTRRQSPATDPDRPSDRQRLVARELDVANVEDAPESGPDPVSGAEAVGDASIKPGDERAMREAGLDASPRPTSTPKESVEPEEGPTAAEPSDEVGPAGPEAGPREPDRG